MKTGKYLLHSLLVLAVFTLLYGCTNDWKDKDWDGYIIKGKIHNATVREIFLERLTFSKTEIVDTAQIEDGNFYMKGRVPYTGLYRLRISPEKNWLLVLDNGVRLEAELDYADIRNFNYKGYKDARVLQKLIQKMGPWQELINQKAQEYRSSLQDPAQEGNRMQLLQSFQGEQAEYENYLKAFIDTVSNPVIAIFAATFLNTEKDFESIRPVVERAKAKLPESDLIQEYASSIEQIARQKEREKLTSVGSIAPNITLPDPEGNMLSLYDLRGKVVLLDFWASWCMPCRRENPNLVKAYKKYKDKGFAIFSVSLDGVPKQKNAKQNWQAAIVQDGLEWPWHVSDLKGWNSEAAKIYGINSIPAAFLIDRDGKIIAKNLRGSALEQTLDEIFSAK